MVLLGMNEREFDVLARRQIENERAQFTRDYDHIQNGVITFVRDNDSYSSWRTGEDDQYISSY